MKKYLMTGIAALVLSAGFTSCSHNDDIEPITQEQITQAKYKQAFETAFGTINPNVNWGFNPVTIVSIDKSGAVTRGHNVNRNEWGTGNGIGGNIKVPQNVTVDERQSVYDYFNKVRKEDKTVQVNWTDFFISEVWKGEATYNDGNGNSIGVASNKMNHLQVRKGDGSLDNDGKLVGDWEHANDFNNGNHNSTYGTIEGHTFMNNSGTLEFAYHNSVDSKYHNEYLIVAGATIDPSLAGYFYVAFDFYATHPSNQPANKNMDVERDYIYTDWIVRISPGEATNAQRVMIEDLIATNLSQVDQSDWDFNDAVFDVWFANEWIASLNANKLVAHITLHAAGGTMSLTVGGKEVHQLFGVTTKTMVNTNASSVGVAKDNLAPVQFNVILGDADYSGRTHTADEIPVYVGSIELTTVKNEAPQKIVTSTSTRWMKEKVIITDGYEKFSNYVQSDSPKNWYDIVTNAGVLY